ncbi:MAG: hypothetical protein JO201_00125 [Verrucomicrobia bacterium]|nr:hypothetical protein [Verrucomicrobiota bacterium]
MGSEALAVLTRVGVLGACGRTLEELGLFNRFVRLIGGRRNIYVWIFAVGIAVGRPVEAYKVMAIWAMATAVVQLPSALISIRTHRGRILPSELTVQA